MINKIKFFCYLYATSPSLCMSDFKVIKNKIRFDDIIIISYNEDPGYGNYVFLNDSRIDHLIINSKSFVIMLPLMNPRFV